MPEPSAEASPPPRGTVDKGHPDPGSEPLAPEEGLQRELANFYKALDRGEPASSSGSSWSWESWSTWDWREDSWRDNRWSWRNAFPDGVWEESNRDDSDRQADDMDGDDTVVNWDNVSSAHGHRGRDDASSTRSQPATKRSRSTQVSDEFVKRSVEPSPEATTETAADDGHLTQLQRLEVIIDLLESLARSGLPTLINSFQRSGDFTKLHSVFHTDASTASFPRVGNWNLALVGSLLCPPLRGVYNNERPSAASWRPSRCAKSGCSRGHAGTTSTKGL